MRLSLDNPAGASYQRLIRHAADELRDSHSLTRQLPAAQQQLEQLIVSTLLLGHSHNHSSALQRPQSAAAPYYVKKAEAYMEAHFAEPLSLADIAAHAGVSARSLQSGFQNFRKMTPMAFLRSVRLQHCQQALLKADPAVSKVTEIAMNCGFSHLGEFAALYGRTFGETPKQTLSRIVYR
jgi:transcriptional regulator GlxA family with amidase domain